MTKIEWTDMTWNCVWGCENACPYCYARKIAKRFGSKIVEKELKFLEYLHYEALKYFENNIHTFKPTWLESNFQKPFPKKPKRIFVNSMSDIAFWKPSWMERTLEKIREYPQHTFQFLTKFPEIYLKYSFSGNCWLGVTLTNNEKIKSHDFFFPFHCVKSNGNNIKFLSIEPIQEKINVEHLNKKYIDWIIVGFQTNPIKSIEEKYIINIINYTQKNKIPLFFKDSINKIYSELPKFREFP